MNIGYLLLEGLTLAAIIFGSLGVFWLHAGPVKEEQGF
jgi:hypothetical protein